MRPDVTATFDNEQIFFEILVSHAVDSDKEKMLIDGQHKSVEINLRECITSTFEEIKSFVLDKTSNKRVIFWEKENVLVTEIEAAIEPVMQKTKKRNENWFEPILYLAIAVIIFLGLRRLLINRRRR
jgi:hypothetical protein